MPTLNTIKLYKLNPIVIKQDDDFTWISFEEYPCYHTIITAYQATFAGEPAIVFKTEDAVIGAIIKTYRMDTKIIVKNTFETFYDMSLNDIAIKPLIRFENNKWCSKLKK